MIDAARSTSFIGRDSELSTLLAAARGERRGVTTWLVGGDAGVGKTRLVNEVERRLDDHSVTIAFGSCIHTAQGSLPYVAVTDVLTSLCRRSDSETVGEIVSARPELGIFLADWSTSGAPSTDGSSAVARLALFDAVCTLIGRLAEVRPLCIVLEDLHWADPSTRDMLVYLVNHLAGAEVALIGTYRRDEMSRTHPLRAVLADLDRSSLVEHLVLPPFDPDELQALATELLPEPPTARVLDELVERSGGNAFYATEILDASVRGRRDVRPELSDLILARIEALPERTQAVLRTLAVGGESVRHELLETVVDDAELELDTALREAVELHVVSIGNDGSLRFRHALMQEAVYATLLPRERQRTHARYAHALVENRHLSATRESCDAELAWHFREAREFARSVEASVAAAATSESMLAFSEGFAHLRDVLELWDDIDDAETRVGASHLAVLQRAARLADRAGDYPRAAKYQHAAIDEARTRPPAEQGVMHERLGRYLQAAGHAADALVECRRAVELVPADPATPERAQVMAGLGQQLMLTMNIGEALTVLPEAIEIAVRTGARRIEGHALNTYGTVLVHGGLHAVGLPMLGQALEIAREVGAVDDELRVYVNLTGGLLVAGDLREAARVGQEGVDVARRHGQEAGDGFFIVSNLCEALSELGRWDDALELAARSKRPEGRLARTWILHHSVSIAIRRGDLEEARRQLGTIDDESLELIDPQVACVYWQGRAVLALGCGDVEAARDAIERGLRNSEVFDQAMTLRAMAVTVEVEARRRGVGGDTGARAHLEAIESLVRERGVEPDERAPRLRARLAEMRAGMCELEGADARAGWAEAAAAWEAGGFRWQHAHALVRLGSAMLQHGARSDALGVLEESVSIAEDLGARPLAAEARELIAHAGLAGGGSVDGRDRTHTTLTEREHAVLELVAEGRTNRQIGDALFMSPKTASVHVSRILQKLGVENRTEAAAAARRAGLVP